MRIKTVRSLGYGPLPDGFQMSLDATGLIPLVGPNEAGKSSLLNLLRALLYKDRRNNVREAEGGRLEVEMDDGTVIHAERRGQRHRVFDAQGRALAEDEWERKLAADYKVFENVYAFGLGELERGESLDAKTVGARLISAGLGVHVDVVKVESTLQLRARELYAPRGVKPPLNVALADIRRLEDEIARGEAELSRYDALQAELAAVEEQASAASDEERQAAADRKRLADMDRIWERFERLRSVMREQAALSHARDIGPELIARFQRLRDQLEASRTRAAAQEERVLQARLALPAPERLHAFRRPEWVAIMEEAREIPDWKRDIDRHRGAAEELWTQMTAESERLGITPERLAAGMAVRVIEPQMDALHQARADARRNTAEAERALSEAEREVAETDALLDGLREIPRREEWSARRARLEALFARPRPAVDGPWFLWAAAVLLALVGAGLARSFLGAVVDAGAAAAALAGLVLSLMRRSARSHDALSAAGVSSWDRLPAERLYWDELGARVTDREQAEERLARARRAVDGARAVLLEARRQQGTAERAYVEGRAGAELPDLEGPELQHWLSRVDDALHTVSQYRRAREQMADVERTRARFLDRAAAAAVLLHLEVQDTHSPDTWWRLRQEWLDIPTREETLRGQEADAEGARTDALRDARLLAECLQDLDVPDAGAAAARVSEALQYEALAREAMGLQAELSAASHGQGVEAFLPYQDVGLEGALEAQRVRFDEIRAARQERQQQAAVLRQRLSLLETSGELSDLRLQAEARRGEARRLYQRWAAYTLAAQVLQESREHFQRERQPEVLRRASSLFASFTAGRYLHVLAQADSVHDLAVELSDGRRYPVEELSRGTQEQLYLALRLAWIEDREQHAERMPLVLDDILVNADPEREQVMARTLVRFAQNRQVLYLTCHPEIERSLKRAKSRKAVPLASLAGAR